MTGSAMAGAGGAGASRRDRRGRAPAGRRCRRAAARSAPPRGACRGPENAGVRL